MSVYESVVHRADTMCFLHRVVPYSTKNNSQLEIELQRNKLWIKKEIHWPTSDLIKKYSCCESFERATSTTFRTKTRSCATIIWPKCSESSASRSQNLPSQNCYRTRTEWKRSRNLQVFKTRIHRCASQQGTLPPLRCSRRQIMWYWSLNNPENFHRRLFYGPTSQYDMFVRFYCVRYILF